MLLRVKTSVVGIAALLLVLALSHTPVFNAAAALIGATALYELYRAAGLLKNRLALFAGLALCVCLPFFEYLPFSTLFAAPFLYLALLVAAAISDPETVPFDRLCVAFTLGLLIAAASLCLVMIRRLPHGAYLIYLVLMIPWITDSFAYIFGSKLGRRKLCPRISPKKTVEGFLFGMLGGAASVLVFGLVITAFFSLRLDNWLVLLLGATLCSLAGQAGDLVFSLCKRYFGIKDFGALFPGHGGMADRFDSVFFVAPVLFGLLVNCNALI
jgi:phosphatidate cytidylyltransferase